jgi:hypothetical protein
MYCKVGKRTKEFYEKAHEWHTKEGFHEKEKNDKI